MHTLGHINIDHVLRIVGVIRSHGRLELRTLIQLGQIVLDDAKELVQVATSTVLHHQRDTRVGRETGNHRRSKGQNLCILDMSCLEVYLCQYASRLVWIEEETIDTIALPKAAKLPPEAFLALLKRFQLDDKRSLVGTCTGNEVVTLYLLTVLDGRVGSEYRIYLSHHLLGTGL